MATFENIHIEYSGPRPYAVLGVAWEHMTVSGLCELEYVGHHFIVFNMWHFNEDYTTQMKSTLDDIATELKGRIEYSVPNHGLYFERQWEEEE